MHSYFIAFRLKYEIASVILATMLLNDRHKRTYNVTSCITTTIMQVVVMNVKMCCPKCEEKAREECQEVSGRSVKYYLLADIKWIWTVSHIGLPNVR